MFKIPSATPFPTDRETGVAYTVALADGIMMWGKIDVVVIPLAIILWAVGIIPAIILGLAILFAVGCPIIMTLGFSIGCLQYLSAKECYQIVRNHLVIS